MLTKITDEFKEATLAVLELPREQHRKNIGVEVDSLNDSQNAQMIDELHANLATLNKLVAKVQYMNSELKGLIRRR